MEAFTIQTQTLVLWIMINISHLRVLISFSPLKVSPFQLVCQITTLKDGAEAVSSRKPILTSPGLI